jgi:hypothetical protein
MQAILLQHWATIRGATMATTVNQPADRLADLLLFQDLFVCLEVSDVANATWNIQTSPTKDETLFGTMSNMRPTVAGVSNAAVLYSAAALPLSRYVRWQLTGTAAGAWSATFRIWLSCNLRGPVAARHVGRNTGVARRAPTGGAPSYAEVLAARRPRGDDGGDGALSYAHVVASTYQGVDIAQMPVGRPGRR